MPRLEFQSLVWKGFRFKVRRDLINVNLQTAQGPDANAIYDARFQQIGSTLQGSSLVWRYESFGTIRLRPGQSLEQSLDKLENDPQLRPFLDFVEPDYQVRESVDPDFSTKSVDGSAWEWGFGLMGIPQAWLKTVGTNDVFIVVADSGIVPHKELNPHRMVHGGNFLYDAYSPAPYVIDGVFTSALPPEMLDGTGHGTKMAGLIGARALPKGVGVAGINWGSEIGVCRVLDDWGFGSASGVFSAVVEAILGAKGRNLIVNLSLNLDDTDYDPGTGTPPETLFKAFDLMASTAQNANALLVCAGGNDGTTKTAPLAPAVYASSYPKHVIAVGLTRLEGPLEVVHENSHDGITLVAPGHNWPVLVDGDGYLPDFVGDGPHTGEWGSSVATALVTGVASLVWSFKPGLSAGGVVQTLLNSAQLPPPFTPGPDPRWGAGRVNAQLALLAV